MTTPATSGVFLPSRGGVVALEVESIPPTGGSRSQWLFESKHAGYSGEGYYRWNSPDTISSPGRGVLTYNLSVDQSTDYYLSVRALRHLDGRPPSSVNYGQENDFWARINGGEWTKVFFSTPVNEWGWASTFSENGQFSPVIYALEPGTHVLEISGRSANTMIDRIHLAPERVNATLSWPLSERTGTPPPPPVNEVPVLAAAAAGSLSYVEADEAVQISPNGLGITDGDDANMASAVVTISNNYMAGQDILSVSGSLPSGVTSAFDSATGSLTLTGAATREQYRALLQSVAYTNLSDTPSELPRTVSFTVNDGDANSNTVTRTIQVTDTPAPVPPIPEIPLPEVPIPIPIPEVPNPSLPSFSDGFFSFAQLAELADIFEVDIPYAPVDIGGLNVALLFDEGAYLAENLDVAAAVLGGGFTSGYEHFVSHGWQENRDPSTLFDQDFYLSMYNDVAVAVVAGVFGSAFEHFALYGHKEGRSPSSLFDAADYLANNADVVAAVAAGAFQSGFEHWIEHGGSEGRTPNVMLFNESYYLANNADVATAVASGVFASGLQHYGVYGALEGRNPSAMFNEEAYLAANADVAGAVASGALPSGFLHYVTFGRLEGRATAV